jgi:hypothetical protein
MTGSINLMLMILDELLGFPRDLTNSTIWPRFDLLLAKVRSLAGSYAWKKIY